MSPNKLSVVCLFASQHLYYKSTFTILCYLHAPSCVPRVPESVSGGVSLPTAVFHLSLVFASFIPILPLHAGDLI